MKRSLKNNLGANVWIRTGWVVLLTWQLSILWTSWKFPPINPDEVLIAAHGYHFLTGQGQRYALNDTIFAADAYKMRDATFEVTRPTYDFWVGLFVRVWRTPQIARFSSWLA